MAHVRTGLVRIFEETHWKDRLANRRIAWLANPVSVDPSLTHAVDRSLAEGLNIVRLFGPEHGLRAGAQDMISVDSNVDALTGLPTVSLYGHDEASLRPKPEHLDGIDVVLIDLQDIGSRYYTYAYTAAFMLELCAQCGVEAWLLDRPNPIGGLHVEGNLVRPECQSFVGAYAIPTRHGLSLGELLTLLATRHGWVDALTVVPMQGWQRSHHYHQTGLPWVMPSPNMPTEETALVYPGQCLLEGTNLSEGRGTTRPFELFGAPWIDANALRDTLTDANLPGCAWRAVAFEPTFQKHARTECQGVQLHVTDRDAFRPVRTSLTVLQTLLQQYPDDFCWRTEVYEFVNNRLAIDLLLGDTVLRTGLEDGMPIPELEAAMDTSRAPFDDERNRVFLYE